LRATGELLLVPPEDAEKRATAAAWWKALTASPESQMQDEQRLQHVQEHLMELAAINTANNKGLQELADKVQQADEQRYANGLVSSLAGMLFVVVLAMAWAWRRLRKTRTPGWVTSLYGPDSRIDGTIPIDASTRQTPTAPTQDASPPSSAVPRVAPLAGVVKVDTDLDQVEPGAPTAPTTIPAAGGTRIKRPSGFSHSGFSIGRAIDSGVVLNAREQAEFFVALGQSNKAIEVLSNRIAQVGESSPLVGLDLLKIYHAEGQQDDFEFMRREFMRWFAVRVPAFDMFTNKGQSLESYPHTERNIVDLWPTPPVLEYIEACIYQGAEKSDGIVFDMQAYLDLLLLYGVAKRIVRQATDERDAAEATELLRIPHRAQDTATRQTSDAVHDTALAHRAGAHLRGTAPDDSTLPRMRTPQPTPSEAPNDNTEKHKGLTDFGFMHLH